MGWFSKTDDSFFLATIVPPADACASSNISAWSTARRSFGANIFRDMFSSIRDVVGGRAGADERALAGARDAALDDMKAAARELGANGVVGLDFDYECSGENNGMMMVSVSGTAVRESAEPPAPRPPRDHVPQHPHAVQLRAARHRRRGPRAALQFGAQAQRVQRTFACDPAGLRRPCGRRGGRGRRARRSARW